MTYLAFEDQGECYLLVDSAAIERHPLFFANLLSSCVSAVDMNGERLDALSIWQAVNTGHWLTLLARYQTLVVTPVLQHFLRPGVMAIKQSSSRQDGVSTIFYECDGKGWVMKLSQAQAKSGELVLLGEPIHPGMAYDIYLRQLAARGDFTAWRHEVKRFISAVFKQFALSGGYLQGAAIDAVARNAVLSEQGDIAFFDLECSEYTTPSKTFFIYRLCCSFEGRNPSYLNGSGFTCRYEIYRYLCAHFTLNASDYVKDVQREAAFQAWVSGQPVKKIKYFKGLQPFVPQQRASQKMRRLLHAFRLLVLRCCA